MKKSEPENKVEHGLALPSSNEAARTDGRTAGHVKKLARSMQALGLVGITQGRLAAFRQLGVDIEPAGLLKDARAGAMVAQQVAMNVLLDLKAMHEKASDKGKVRLVPHIGFMVRALAASNRGVSEAAGGVPAFQANGQANTHVVVHTMVPLGTGIPEKAIVDVPEEVEEVKTVSQEEEGANGAEAE